MSSLIEFHIPPRIANRELFPGDSSLVINYHSRDAPPFRILIFFSLFFFLLSSQRVWPDASIEFSMENSFFVHDFLTCPSNDDTAFRVIRLVNGDESKKSKLLADKLNFLS